MSGAAHPTYLRLPVFISGHLPSLPTSRCRGARRFLHGALHRLRSHLRRDVRQVTSRGARAHGCRRIRVSNPHSPADSRFTVTCLPGTATVNARLCPNLSLRPFLRPETVSWAALCPTPSNSPGNSEWDLIRRQGQRRRHELRRNEVPLEQDGLRHGWRPCGSGTFGRRGGCAGRTAWEEDGDGAMRQTPRTSPEHGATDPALRPQRGPAGPAPDSQAPASGP